MADFRVVVETVTGEAKTVDLKARTLSGARPAMARASAADWKYAQLEMTNADNTAWVAAGPREQYGY